MLAGFKHQLHIQVRFKDVDSMGHVNHVDYLSYVELARLKYFDDVLGTPNTDWHRQDGLIMAKLEADYKDAIVFDDRIMVYTRCANIGTKSFELNWAITKIKTDGLETIAAEGKCIIVCYDYGLKKAREIPEERRLKLKQFENL